MLAPSELPAEYAEWNARLGAPSGARWRHGLRDGLRMQLARFQPERVRERRRGPFQYQLNNSTRVFEYPWAFHTAGVRPGMEVLEIGGGLSGFQFALAGAGCRVVNVDPGMQTETFSFPCDQASMARLNAVYATDVQLRNTTLDRAGLADASFDVAFSISVLEHLDDEQLATAVREAYRVLRRGGRLVMTVDLYLNAAPFTEPVRNRYGRNVDLRALASHAPFERELGEPSQLHGFPEFDTRRILADLDRYLIGSYPALVQCMVLRKP